MTDPVTAERFDAVLFDLDGVLTSTARVHAVCWKQMFDEYLKARSEQTDEPFRPFDVTTDYRPYVDGKPRDDGVRSFLQSRGIHLPEGSPDDSPTTETIQGLGNRKNELVHRTIERDGVEVFHTSVRWAKRVRDRGVKVAVVTSSKNCDRILNAAGISDLFPVRVDGNTVTETGMSGKPAPDAFLHAAALLGVEPSRAVVVEDAVSGVQAGAAGGFGLVIGVDRHDDAAELHANGADVVVSDLGEFLTEARPTADASS